jgi:hypothetical protein
MRITMIETSTLVREMRFLRDELGHAIKLLSKALVFGVVPILVACRSEFVSMP